MNKFFKASIVLGAAVFLTACGDSVKILEPQDNLFKITVSSAYEDVMDKRDAIIAGRLEGTPAENITLLQAKKGDITNDLLYAVTLKLPEGVVITLKEFEEVMNEQMEAINEIVDFKVSPVAGSNTQITYVAETKDQGKPYFEHCKISVDNSITTICIGTSNDQKAAKEAIEGIEFLSK